MRVNNICLWKLSKIIPKFCLISSHLVHLYPLLVCVWGGGGQINRICHWSPMQIEKSQLEGKWIMPETRFTEFPALSMSPRVWISRLYWRPMFDYFSYL